MIAPATIVFPKFLEHASPKKKLFYLLLLVLAGLSAFTLLGAFVAMLVYGTPAAISEPGIIATDPVSIAYLKVVQLFSAIGVFLFPALTLSYLSGGKVFRKLGADRPPSILALVFPMFMMLALLPWINITAEWNSRLVLPEIFGGINEWMRESENRATALTEGFLQMPDVGSFLFTLLIMAVLPAIGEEFLFRGTVLPLFISILRNKHLAVWVTAFIFSFIHFQFFGFLPRFLIGAFLGYLMLWSGNIWLPVAAHFANNAIAVTAWFLMQHSVIHQNLDEIGQKNMTGMQLLISAFIVAVGMYFMHKIITPEKIRHEETRKVQ